MYRAGVGTNEPRAEKRNSKYHMELSLNRAKAVAEAIENAAGAGVELDSVTLEPHGFGGTEEISTSCDSSN